MKLENVVFLEVDEVELAHALSLERHGGQDGLRSRALLESAVMAPRSTWGAQPLYPSLAAMAVAYAVGIAGNHPFLDGNKRTAFIAMLAFLDVNGISLTLDDAWIAIIEGLAAGAVSRDELIEQLVHAMPRRDPVAVEP